MTSPESEYVPFVAPVDPKGKNIEAWMVEVKDAMIAATRDNMYHAILDYTTRPRTGGQILSLLLFYYCCCYYYLTCTEELLSFN